MFMLQSSGEDFLKGKKIVAVNSINWARIMSQIVYYFYCAVRAGASESNPVSFSVPTGNFGDIYAGYLAKRMGLPIKKLIVATNDNDILARFINSNDYSRKELLETLSPSMNIQVSSNFERLLFDAYAKDGNPKEVAKLMEKFEMTGKLEVEPQILESIRKDFVAYAVNDQKTCELIKELYEETQETIDPHSVIGIAAGREYIASEKYSGEQVITLATAHPAKFPDAIKKSKVKEVDLPHFLTGLMDKKEKMDILENDVETIKSFISQNC
jgi:threonine synthase